MKANELMIGDWVRWTSDQWSTEEDSYPFRIKGTCSNKVQIEDRIDWYVDSLIDPIPLTDEILRNNGFEYFHKNYASISNEHPFRLRLDKWPDENGLGAVWTICDIIEIRYVHQLQHALRDCGIDEEIKIKL